MDLVWLSVPMGDQRLRSADSLSFIPPKLAILVDKPRAGDSSFHETKYDGYWAEFSIAIRKMGPERIVSKRQASSYQRLPVERLAEDENFQGEFAVVGYGQPAGTTATLLVAADQDSKLRNASRAHPPNG